MAKKGASKKKGARKSANAKRSTGRAVTILGRGGSPITVDGGSISIFFLKPSHYKPGTTANDHIHTVGKKIGTLIVTDASGNKVDFSAVALANPNLCKVKIFYTDRSGKFDPGSITITGGPIMGINFDGDVFEQTGPGTYSNADVEVDKVEVGYAGGWGKTTFAQPTIGKCTIFVDVD